MAAACERITVAGSVRRGKAEIGDIEILYISKTAMLPASADMFAQTQVSLADGAIALLEFDGVLERRKNAKGATMYGPKNKLLRHCVTGLPVDLFAATPENWWNYLVCRTGPAESNMRIAMAAKRFGWKWNPYGAGFSRGSEGVGMHSEEEVFAFVGLPYAKPEERR